MFPLVLKPGSLTPRPNESYTSLVGAPPNPWRRKAAFYSWCNRLIDQRRANVPTVRATTYYFSTSGNNANPGTEASPKQTLAHMQTLLTAAGTTGNIRFRFKRGDTWREGGNVTVRDNITIDAYGSGDKPIWTNFTHQYAASSALWTLESGTTWQLSTASNIAWLKYASSYTPLQRLATKANVNSATIPSFTWIDADDKIYLNLQGADPNSVAWEATEGIADFGVALRGDSVRFQDIVLVGHGMRTNAANQTYSVVRYADASDDECVIERIESYYGGYHPFGALAIGNDGGISTFIDCKAGYYRGDASHASTVFVCHSEHGGAECIFDTFEAVTGPLWENGQQRRASGGYGHTAGSAYTHALCIAKDVTYTAGDMASYEATYWGNMPDPDDNIENVRGFIIGETFNDPTRWVKFNSCPSYQAQLDCYFAGGTYDVLGAGGCQAGWSIDCVFVSEANVGAGSYTCLWAPTISNAGTFVNCYLQNKSKGTIFDNGGNASGWVNKRILNSILITKDPASGTANNEAAPNISASSTGVLNNAYWCQSTVTANANVVPTGTDGLGAVTAFDPNAVMLTGTPPVALATPAVGGSLDNGDGYWAQPDIDYYGNPRGTEATIGPVTSGYVASTAPSVPVATYLAFNQQPTGVLEDTAITPAVTVRACNSFSLTADTFVSNVSMAIKTGTGSLTGTTTKAAVAGVATFSDLVIDTAGTFTLEATSSGLTADTSSSFDISASWSPTDMTNKELILLRGDWYTDTGMTTKWSANGQSCKGWKAASGPSFTEATNAPVIDTATTGLVGGLLTVLNAASNITLSGNCTVYVVATITTSKNNCFIANASGGLDYFGYYTDNIAYMISGAGNNGGVKSGLGLSSGRKLFRFRRNGSTYTIKATGLADTTMTTVPADPTYTLNSLFKSTIVADTTATLKVEDVFVFSADKNGTAEETSLLAWLFANREGIAF